MDFIGGVFDKISQALKDLAKAIGDFLFGDDKEEGQEEWKKEEVVTEIMGHEGMETEPPVISARVRCTCCIDPVSEVYVFPRQNNNVSQAKKQQLNHKDTTLMPPVFSGCTNTPGNVCTVKILDDIWFAPDESIEVGDGYALNEEMSYMVCLTGVGMIYLSDSGQVIESMEDRLVDDDAMNLKRTQMILKKEYNVLLAESGNEALLKLRNEKIDLILLDIAMPVMDGLETFKRMKEASIDIPVIFLTASGYEEDVRTAISLGAVNYLKKPFFPDELLKRVALGLEEQ